MQTLLIIIGVGWIIAIAGTLALLTVGKRNDEARHRAMRRHEAWRSR